MTATAPVLVALDPSDLESQAHILAAAQTEAAQRGTGIALILVIEAMRHAGHGGAFAEMRQNLMHEAAERASAWASPIAPGIKTEVAYGDADEQILAAVDRVGASVLVMGERRKRAIDKVLGSVAQAVNDAAKVQVVLIPPVE